MSARTGFFVGSLFLIAVLALYVPVASACPMYVAPHGDDGAQGGPGDPFATLQHAVTVSTPGDTIYLYDGRFTGPGNRQVDLQAKALWIMSVSGDPAACVVDCGGFDGLVFDDSTVSHVDTLGIEGIRFTHAAVAVRLRNGSFWNADPRGCVLRAVTVDSSVTGLQIRNHVLRWEDIDITATEAGAYLLGCQGEIDRLRVRGAARGLRTDDLWGIDWTLNLREAELVDNGYGVDAFANFQHLIFEDCRVDSNTTVGLFIHSTEVGRAILRRTTVNHNQGHGVWLLEYASLEAEDTEISNNADTGIYVEHSSPANVYLHDVLVHDNGDWGVRYRRGFIGQLTVYSSSVRGNALGGCRTSVPDVAMDGTVIAGNGGTGLWMVPGYDVGGWDISATTIVDNRGRGIVSELIGGFMGGVLVAGNDSVGVSVVGTTGLDVVCTDLHGNGGGDWVGDLAGYLGADGNIDADPCFCDPSAGNYELCATSPCLPTAPNYCYIGALDRGCGTPADAGVPVPRPTVFRLLGARPNPFNPVTAIIYELPAPAMVTLRVYDPRGRLVQVLENRRPRGSGRHEALWRGRDLQGRAAAAGVYLVRMEAGGFSSAQRLTLIR